MVKSPGRRVALISSTFPFGQGEEFLVAELMGLQSQGIEISVITMWPRGNLNSAHLRLMDKHFALQKNRIDLKIFLQSFIQDLFLSRNLNPFNTRSLLKRLIRNSVATALAPQLVQIVKREQFDHIHAYWASGASTLAMKTSDMSGVEWSFTCHSGDIIEGLNLVSKVKSAKSIRCISLLGKQLLENRTYQNPFTRVIHLGVVVPELSSINQTPKKSNFTIACVASLIPIKDHKTLIRALRIAVSQGAEIFLEIIGEGPLKDTLVTLVIESELSDYVSFLGYIPNEELREMYKSGRFDLIVLPSSTAKTGQQEGIPVSLMEAMSFGLPILSTSTGAVTELIPDSIGLLVNPSDPVQFAEKLIEFYSMSNNERRNLGLKCHKIILENFDIQKTSKEFFQFLSSSL